MQLRILFFLMLLLPAWVSAFEGKPNLRRACLQTNKKDIVLSWNVPGDTCNSFIAYDIYGKPDLTQPFKFLDSVNIYNQNLFIHKDAFIISGTWQYYIVARFNCNGVEETSDTILLDLVQPPSAPVDSISIDPLTGNILIGWSPIPASDLAGYVVYEYVAPDNITIDTVENPFIEISGKNTSSQIYYYSIASIDSCGNLSPISTRHANFVLTHTYDSCSQNVKLSWGNYQGWTTGKFYIYLNKNLEGYSIVDSATSNEYTFNATLGDSLQFFVSALKNDPFKKILSSSNAVRLKVPAPVSPRFNYLTNVTVLLNQINLKWLADINATIKSFTILRSRDSIRFEQIANIPFDGLQEQGYIDTAIKDPVKKYYYMIVVKNNCDKVIDSSNISNNIVLNLNMLPQANTLSWNLYSSWNTGIQEYQLQRGTDFNDVFTWNTITTITDNQTVHIDYPLPTASGNAGFCYYVEAFQNPGDTFGINEISRSNEVCETGDAIIYFPNAFAPAGVNRIFKPSGIYIDYKLSYMKIYDRWGKLVFETLDLRKGWDGFDMDGNDLTGSSYLYMANIRGLNGNVIVKKGMVTLLR
jgi:gliding motility-associated-like protein